MSNLYLLSRNDDVDYDEYDSCVVCADSESEARQIHPNGEPVYDWDSTWAKPETLTVSLIGTANDTVKKGEVVISSFNAG